MVPAPITAARLISRGFTSFARPGIFVASRSAKKICRCAFDWSPARSRMKASRSIFSASSNGISIAARSSSIAAAGASRLRARLVLAVTISLNAFACKLASLSSRSRTRVSDRFSLTTLRAKAMPAVAGSPSKISSINSAASASFAGIGSPERIIAAAFSMPTRRGRRCVPPAPGMSPSLISGRPSRVPVWAMRKWQASVISSPPPSVVPNTAATTGFLIASISAITSERPGDIGGLSNSVMSAPATKVRPCAVRTIASVLASSRARVKASTRAVRTSRLNALTGGLSTAMTATAPSWRNATVPGIALDLFPATTRLSGGHFSRQREKRQFRSAKRCSAALTARPAP